MPVDASIPLSGIAPKIPSAQEMVSLSAMMEQMRERKEVADQRKALLASEKVKEILGSAANAYYTTEGDEDTKNRAKQKAIIDQVGELRQSGLYRSLGFNEQKLDEMIQHSNIEVAKIHSLITPPEKIQQEAQEKQATGVMQQARERVRLSEVAQLSPEDRANPDIVAQHPQETPASLRAQASDLLAIPNNPVARKQAEQLRKDANDLEKANRAERAQKTTQFLTEQDRLSDMERRGQGDTTEARRLRSRLDAQGGTSLTEEQYKLHGKELLDTLSPGDRVLVEGIASLDLDPFIASRFKGQQARIMTLVRQYKPDYNEQDYKESLTAATRFGSGRQGDQVRAFNVGLEHLDTLQSLVGALDTGNVQLINKAKNMWVTQTGGDAPTNFEAGKQVVAAEVVKAIVGGGGALTDREEASRKIMAASSPKQLLGVIDTYKHLFGGQLHGLEQQYKAATKRKDFRDRYLTPVGRDAAESADVDVSSRSSSGGRQAPSMPDVTEEDVDAEIERRRKK